MRDTHTHTYMGSNQILITVLLLIKHIKRSMCGGLEINRVKMKLLFTSFR